MLTRRCTASAQLVELTPVVALEHLRGRSNLALGVGDATGASRGMAESKR
jgi:hypothetical protein